MKVANWSAVGRLLGFFLGFGLCYLGGVLYLMYRDDQGGWGDELKNTAGVLFGLIVGGVTGALIGHVVGKRFDKPPSDSQPFRPNPRS